MSRSLIPMPLDPELVAKLVHPDTHEPVRQATDQELADLNRRIAAGSLRDLADSPVHDQLAEALVAPSAGHAFPVRDGFPIMLVDSAIALASDSVPGRPTTNGPPISGTPTSGDAS